MKIHFDKWQQDFLETKGDKILCTGRQVGKTRICSKDAGDYAVNTKKSIVLMIAPTERQARNLFNMTLDYLMEDYSKLIKMGKDRPTKSKIELKNGTKIYCLPTGVSGMGIRGLTIHRLYVDEASQVPEEVWSAVNPMLLTTGGDSIYLSTPFGARGEFYRCWINQDKAYDSFKRFSINSEKVVKERLITASWSERIREKALQRLDQAKARMSNREYAQEYLGEFIADLNRYFLDKTIRDVCILKRPGNISFNHEYVLGVDIARMGEDESSFEILQERENSIVQVENLITKKTLTTETEDRIINLDLQYDFKNKGIGIDAGSGSLGVGIFDHLIRHDDIKGKVVAINNRARVMDRDGGKAKLLKEDLYDNLLALMHRGQIKLLDDETIIESLRSIQYEYVKTEGKPTRLRIFGNYSHVVEGIIRAAILAQTKDFNMWIESI